VTCELYSDYECPHCAIFYLETMPQLAARYVETGKVRLIHRDFTLRNILVDDGANVAYVFDFDLAMSLDDIGSQTYRSYYKGRIFGSPGWSVAPRWASLQKRQVSAARTR